MQTETTMAAKLNRYVTPDGAGKKDGSDWDNAMRGNIAGGLQNAWNSLPNGGILYVGSGTYESQKLTLTAGGSGADSRKVIQGQDTGDGLPVFSSTWRLDGQNSDDFIDVQVGASNFEVKGLIVKNYRNGVYMRGKNAGFEISGMEFYDMSDGIYIIGGIERREGEAGYTANPDEATHSFVISDCKFIRYAKRGIRFRNGVYDGVINDCYADGGGKDNWFAGNFPMSFQVGDSDAKNQKGAVDHDITFNRCYGMNNYHDNGTGYWNADGFCTERNTKNIVYNDCVASGNTDGGWDCKTDEGLVLNNCIAVKNKRNYRIWSRSPAVLNNCLAAYAATYGGNGAACDLYLDVKAVAILNNCTLYSPAKYTVLTTNESTIELNNCVIVSDKPDPIFYYNEKSGVRITFSGKDGEVDLSGETKVTLSGTAEFIPGKFGDDPKLNAPSTEWDFTGNAFDNALYGDKKGFVNKLE